MITTRPEEGTSLTHQSHGPVLLRLHNLSKKFQEAGQERVVFRDIDLSIHDGEILVLLGKSGSGKTTLLNLISGIDMPTTGEIFFQSTTLTSLSEQDRTLFRRHHIGFIFQFFNLIPTLTVEENVLLPLELKRGRVSEDDRQKAFALLESVELTDRLKSFPDRLSGGEQQRIAIARALAHDPLLLLADEPTGNLDNETSLQVLDLLDRLTRQNGKTLVMVTHSPDVIGYADRILIIQGGQLLERSQ